MDWRSKRTSQSWSDVPEKGHSSAEEWSASSSLARYSHAQRPARDTSEALWRAVKRVGSACRWLKVDLALLAEHGHGEVLDLLASVVKLIGQELVPRYGKEALDPKDYCRAEVIDLVALLCSLPASSGSVPRSVPRTSNTQQLTTVATQTLKEKGNLHKQVQTHGTYMRRISLEELVGDWQPCDSIRILRCTAAIYTDTIDTFDFNLKEGCLAKIIRVDSDGDAQIAVLSSIDSQNLWSPLEARWLLQRSYSKFEQLLPTVAVDESASIIRDRRKNRFRGEDS